MLNRDKYGLVYNSPYYTGLRHLYSQTYPYNRLEIPAKKINLKPRKTKTIKTPLTTIKAFIKFMFYI